MGNSRNLDLAGVREVLNEALVLVRVSKSLNPKCADKATAVHAFICTIIRGSKHAL
jgi:hypothetical protein